MSPINDDLKKEVPKTKSLRNRILRKRNNLKKKLQKKKALRRKARKEGCLPSSEIVSPSAEEDKTQNLPLKFTVDCSRPVEDNLMDVADFEKYLQERIKVNGITNNFGTSISLESNKTELSVIANIHFSKLYLKYLTKKFLHKSNLRSKFRVVANGKDSYELQNVLNNEENEVEERNLEENESNVKEEERNAEEEDRNVKEERNIKEEERNVKEEERNVKEEEINVKEDEMNVEEEERNIKDEERNVKEEERNVKEEEMNVKEEEIKVKEEEMNVEEEESMD